MENNRYKFDPIKINTSSLCDDNDMQEICFQVFQYNSNGSHKKLSQAIGKLGEMKACNGSHYIITGGKGLKLIFNKPIIQPRVSFLDYVFGGLEMTVHVAIDYTLSNGPPDDPNSLHFVNR